jgi:hypothetical protein
MRSLLVIVLITIELFTTTICASSQANSPRMGAAEKAMERGGLPWPYPEPAEPGATGYRPNYSVFEEVSERWDIYINLLWRKTDPRNKVDGKYFDEEISQLMDSMPAEVRRTFASASGLSRLIARIRAKQVSLPYNDPITGCLLFMANRMKRVDLAADNCQSRN